MYKMNICLLFYLILACAICLLYALFRNVSERCPQKATQRYKNFFEFANSFCIFFKKNYFLSKNGLIWVVELAIF